MTLRLLLTGAGGQTGSRVLALAKADDRFEVAGRIGQEGRALPAADALIDFSVPEQAARVAAACAAAKMPLITGTTGLSDDQQAAVAEAARAIPVVQSGNFSTGVTVLAALAAKAATLLDEDYDIEIFEAHHRRKKDAPSGTALLIGEAVAQARGTTIGQAAIHTRHDRSEARAPAEIGFAVRRGGGVFGDHEVALMAEEETVTLGHRALSRDVFARGALRAAAWAQGRAPGLYAMPQVLGLEGLGPKALGLKVLGL